jgi:hypothetical protein
MTYITEQTSTELRDHIRKLQRTPGWRDPVTDRLFREIVEQDEAIKQLRAQVEGLRTALEPFVALRDQAPSQMAKIIHKGIDGVTPIALTVTKDQFKAACSALSQSVLSSQNVGQNLSEKGQDFSENKERSVSIDLMQRVWANLYYDEEEAGNTFQQTLSEVTDWLADQRALPSTERT